MSTTHVPTELRRLVEHRAGHRCEYCLAPGRLAFHAHQVDHIIAEKHGGETHEANLAFCCIACNQFKGSDLSSIDPATGELAALFHPRRDSWHEHFALRGLVIEPRTAAGRVTVRLLQLNAPERVVERGWFIAAGELPSD